MEREAEIERLRLEAIAKEEEERRLAEEEEERRGGGGGEEQEWRAVRTGSRKRR